MTVWELLRSTEAPPAARWPGPGEMRPSHRQLAAGAGSALAAGLLVVLPALVVWVASVESAVPWTDAVTTGSSLWALGLGARLRVGAVEVAFAPLLFPALVVAGCSWSARGVAAEAAAGRGEPRWGLLPGPVLAALAWWTVGYAAGAALWAALAMLSAAPPEPRTLGLPVVVVPLLAALVAASRLVAADPRLAGPRWPGTVLPSVVRTALAPGLAGAGALLGAGLAACGLLVWLSRGEVAGVHGELGAGVVGGAVLTLGQLLAAPNAALWAVSFAAGTGFSAAEGAATTWTGSRSGLIPMVPALAALPDPGAFPAAMPAVVLLPVAAGALVGWRVLRSLPRLAPLTTTCSVSAVAVLVAAGALGLADAVGGGALGAGRLAHVGAPAAAMTAALVAELAVGAAVVVAAHWWRLRR